MTRRPWTVERIHAARVRGWRRYVRHFGCHICRYAPDCTIAHEQNMRDADLAGLELRAVPVQQGLGL